MTFGEKLLKLRKQNGLSQEELASQLTVSRQAISRWEMGSSMPDVENVTQLSKLFGVSYEYLLNDEYENEKAGILYEKEGASGLFIYDSAHPWAAVCFYPERVPDCGIFIQ